MSNIMYNILLFYVLSIFIYSCCSVTDAFALLQVKYDTRFRGDVSSFRFQLSLDSPNSPVSNPSESSPSDTSSIIQSPSDENAVEDAFGSPVGPLPSVSSRLNFKERDLSEDSLVDLWVVGCGTLGCEAVKQWLHLFPSHRVVAETNTETRHSLLKSLGNVDTRVRSNRAEGDLGMCKNVLICLPPSAAAAAIASSKKAVTENSDTAQKDSHDKGTVYEEELFEASRLWAGPKYGKLVFTSSTAVYGDSNGNIVTETFRLDTRTSRATKMIAAEEAVAARGGTIVRLAGLYDKMRGPHTYWMKMGKCEGNEDAVVNMLHYEDAASAAIAAILTARCINNEDKEIYLVSDDLPITRKEICSAALESGLFETASMPIFTSETGPVGKTVDCTWTKSKLGWKPRYSSFPEYIFKLAGKEYTPLQSRKKLDSSSLWIPGMDDDELF